MARSAQSAATQNKARTAVSEFRKMQPTLTAFAKHLTGNPKIIVQIGKGAPRTDGKIIHYPPPIALGERYEHVPSLCDKRDWETFQQQCPACKVREGIMSSIYHEISHVAFDTFQTPDKARLAEALRYVKTIAPPKDADRIVRRIAESDEIPKSYMMLAGVINQYYRILFNALEDVRINSRMHKARPGTKPMMEAQIMQVMNNGIEQHDGTVRRWTDMHLNHQACIGAYLFASGFAPREGWLAPEVVQAFQDDELQRVLVFVPDCPSVHDVFEVSGVIFLRLRELGFFQLAEEKEEDDAEQSDDNEDGEGESSSPPPTPPQPGAGSPPPEPEQGDSDDEAANDPGAGGGGDDAGSDDTDQSDEADDEEGSSDGDASEDVAEGSEDGSAGGSETEDEPQADDGGSSSSESEDEEAEHGDEGDLEEDGADSAEEGDEDSTSGGSEDDEADSSDGSDSESSGGDADGDDEESGGPTGGNSEGDDEEAELGDEFEDGESFRVEPDEDAESEDIDLDALGLHAHSDDMSKAEEKAVEVAIVQGDYFERPSANIVGVNEWHHENMLEDYQGRTWHAWNPRQTGSVGHLSRRGHGVELTPETILAPALMRLRLVFAENKRTLRSRNQRSGKLDQRVLGRRAWNDDDRLFGKKVIPGKRDYVVYIALDVSGSTAGKNLLLIKQAAMAKAELLSRLGIPFAIFAHTGSPTSSEDVTNYSENLSLDIYHIKAVAEPWDDKIKQRLADIGPSYCNLDGHAMEYYRRMIERENATDRVILYYSDGKMPLENYHEELEILQREIATCKQKNIHLLGVGIRTDSPRRHGLDTVQVDDSSDVIRVVQHLERTLAA